MEQLVGKKTFPISRIHSHLFDFLTMKCAQFTKRIETEKFVHLMNQRTNERLSMMCIAEGALSRTKKKYDLEKRHQENSSSPKENMPQQEDHRVFDAVESI